MISERTTEKLTEVGWIAKGLLFVIIGVLALRIAQAEWAPEEADQRGALSNLVGQPFGRTLVFVVGLGLVLFSVWQVASAMFASGRSPLDLARRIGSFGLGLTYGLLGLTALGIAIRGAAASQSSSSDGDTPTNPEDITAILLDFPFGTALVVVLGLGTIGVAVYHLQKGVRLEFLDDIETSGISRPRRRILVVLGVAGFVARSLALGVVGMLFLDAAIGRDPEQAGGLDDALRSLRDAPYGTPLLSATAAGLFCAGIYDIVTFRRQRM